MREKLIDLAHDYFDYVPWYADIADLNPEELIDHLIANGVTIPQWIPVSERLPKEDERVLVWLGAGEITYTQIDTDRLHKGKWRRWSKHVTHWMPLPEPPKEVE